MKTTLLLTTLSFLTNIGLADLIDLLEKFQVIKFVNDGFIVPSLYGHADTFAILAILVGLIGATVITYQYWRSEILGEASYYLLHLIAFCTLILICMSLFCLSQHINALLFVLTLPILWVTIWLAKTTALSYYSLYGTSSRSN